MLPIPSITRQREMVLEYETLTNRIRLNNQMIQHLEATAQALYRKTFVDNIDKEPEGAERLCPLQGFSPADAPRDISLYPKLRAPLRGCLQSDEQIRL